MRSFLAFSILISCFVIPPAVNAAQRGLGDNRDNKSQEDSSTKILNIPSQHDLLRLIPTGITVDDPDNPTVRPFSAENWIVHPIRIGNVSKIEVADEQVEHAGNHRFRFSNRGLTVSVFNPSLTDEAIIDIDCGDDAKVDHRRKVKEKKLPTNSFISVTISPSVGIEGDAVCKVVSKTPITVSAIAIQIIRQNHLDKYGGNIIHQASVPWPAYSD